MTDAEPFLDALEASPGDDGRWLVFSDWLEERGVDELPAAIRAAVEAGNFGPLRMGEFLALGRRRRRLAACDSLDRLLPIFEARYPDDARPRRFVVTLRAGEYGASWNELRETWNRAMADDSSRLGLLLGRPCRLSAASEVVWLLLDCTSGACLSSAFFNAPYPRLVQRFGPDARYNPRRPYPPQLAAARDLEYRRQVARVLRYRLGLLGGTR